MLGTSCVLMLFIDDCLTNVFVVVENDDDGATRKGVCVA